jgi:hypothetical protein
MGSWHFVGHDTDALFLGYKNCIKILFLASPERYAIREKRMKICEIGTTQTVTIDGTG